MPRRFLRRYLPSARMVREDHRLRRMFGSLLHEANLWHLNRSSVVRAVAVGLLAAFVPVPGQMVLAAAGAIVVRCNLPVAMAMVWVSNPLTMGPLFYITYATGARILGLPRRNIEFEMSLDWLSTQLASVWEPLLLGCLVVGVTTAALGAALVSLLWRVHVGRSWQARAMRRRAMDSRAFSSDDRRSAPPGGPCARRAPHRESP